MIMFVFPYWNGWNNKYKVLNYYFKQRKQCLYYLTLLKKDFNCFANCIILNNNKNMPSHNTN